MSAMILPLKILLLIVALAVLGLGVMEIYTRLPQPVETPQLTVPPAVTRLVLIVHGSADADNLQFRALQKRLEARYSNEQGLTAVRYLRWSPWSDVRLRAAATAQVLGRQLATQLATLPALNKILLIVHSSGAYTADALCESYRNQSARPARIETVYLDAFQIHGFLDWSHGARTHGRCADFALSVINRDDRAPATNKPLKQAYNLDVTGLPKPSDFTRNGHYWPVQYYLDALLWQGRLSQTLSHADYPRGAVVQAPAHPTDGMANNLLLPLP